MRFLHTSFHYVSAIEAAKGQIKTISKEDQCPDGKGSTCCEAIFTRWEKRVSGTL